MVELLWKELEECDNKVWFVLSNFEGGEREDGKESEEVLEKKIVWGEGVTFDREIIWRNMML